MSKYELPNFLRPFVPEHNDQTRPIGTSMRCQYCGGHHSTDAEARACADRNSPRDQLYTCSYCGQRHLTIGAANDCCQTQKVYARKYDSAGYASSSSTSDSYPYSYYDDCSTSTEEDHYYGYDCNSLANAGGSSSGGIFDSLLNFGSKKTESPKPSNDGAFDWFLNAGR